MFRSRLPRSILGIAALSIPALLWATGAEAGGPVASWPMLGGNAAHTGVTAGPAPPYQRAWVATFEDGGPVGAPVATGDRVVVLTGRGVSVLDAATGSTVWEEPRARGPAGPPVVVAGLVVYSQGRAGAATIAARKLTDGEEAWRVESRAPSGGAFTGEDGIAFVGSRNGVVRAIDGDTGKLVWKFEADGRVDTAPAVAGGRVFVVGENFDNGEAIVYALDASTGREDWRLQPERSRIGVSSVSVAGTRAYVGLGDARLRAVAAETGTELWSAPTRSLFSSASAPALPGDIVALDRLGHLYRLDAETGEERWVFRLPGTAAQGSPVVLGEHVVVGDATGQISAIEFDSGELVWKGRVPGGPIGAPAVVGDLVLVASQGQRGRVVAFEHDPGGTLVREPSPTTLFPGRALLNFVAASAGLFALLLGLFRYGLGRRTTALPGPEIPTAKGKG